MKLQELTELKKVNVGLSTKGIENLEDHKLMKSKMEYFKNLNDSYSKSFQGFVLGFQNSMNGNSLYYTLSTKGYKNDKKITSDELVNLGIVDKSVFGYNLESYGIESVNVSFQANSNYNDSIGSTINNMTKQYKKGIKNLIMNIPLTLFSDMDYSLEKLDLIIKIFEYQLSSNNEVVGLNNGLKANLIPLLEKFGYQATKLSRQEMKNNSDSYIEFSKEKFTVKKELSDILKPFKTELLKYKAEIEKLNTKFGYEDSADTKENPGSKNGQNNPYNYVYILEHININEMDKQTAITKTSTSGNYKRLNSIEFNDYIHSNHIDLTKTTKGKIKKDNTYLYYLKFEPSGKFNFNIYSVKVPSGVNITTINKLRNDNMKPLNKNKKDSLTESEQKARKSVDKSNAKKVTKKAKENESIVYEDSFFKIPKK